MQHSFRALFALAVIAYVPTAHAQATIQGKWIAEFEVGLRIINGEATSEGKGKARVMLQQTRDSLLGEWQVIEPRRDPMPESRILHGVVKGDVIIIDTEPQERVVNNGGGEERVKMITRYELKLQGDVLSGTQKGMATDGSFEGPPRPFRAERDKS